MLLVTRSWELPLMAGRWGDGAVSTVCHLGRQLRQGSDFYLITMNIATYWKSISCSHSFNFLTKCIQESREEVVIWQYTIDNGRRILDTGFCLLLSWMLPVWWCCQQHPGKSVSCCCWRGCHNWLSCPIEPNWWGCCHQGVIRPVWPGPGPILALVTSSNQL